MGQGQQKRRAVLIVEDDAELRHLTAALFEDEKLDTIECESAEAALAILLIGGREVAMIFADVRLPGAMGGVDLAWEVKLRWPLLPMILTSGHPLERIRELPPGVAYMPKPWQPLNVLIAAEQALASGQGNGYPRSPLELIRQGGSRATADCDARSKSDRMVAGSRPR
jgi:DNA-binding NtrC family response regulator